MRRSDFVMRLMAMLGVLSAATSFAADRVESDASPAPAANATAELLETGWKASSQRYAQAQDIYQRARQSAPGDVRVPFAMSLVAMRNSKLDEAAKYIDEALPSEKTNFPIRRVEFWIDVQRKDKDAQKSHLRKLAEILVADKLAAERDSYQETSHWLGSVMGYYAFTETGRSLLPVADRQSLAAYISGLLSGSLATRFDAGKNSVEELSKTLENQLDAARQQSKDKNEAQRDVDRQKNEALLSDAYQQLAKATNALAQFQQQSGIDKLENEQRSLQRQLNELNDRSKRLQNLIKNHDQEEDRRAQKDRNYRKQTDYADRNDLDQVNRMGSNALGRQREIGGQLPALQNERKRLSDEVNRQNDLLKRLTSIQNNLAKAPSAADGASASLQGRMRMFTTYVAMDLEQEKQRILATYRGK
jgi:chromosome segregation ATPase